jgi:hypothetical protein
MSENIPASPEDSAAPWKLLQMLTGYWVTQALYVAAKLGIADLLREGPVNCDVLAGKTSTHPQSLYRTLRALASVGVFTEVAPEQFALTPSAALLQSVTRNSTSHVLSLAEAFQICSIAFSSLRFYGVQFRDIGDR